MSIENPTEEYKQWLTSEEILSEGEDPAVSEYKIVRKGKFYSPLEETKESRLREVRSFTGGAKYLLQYQGLDDVQKEAILKDIDAEFDEQDWKEASADEVYDYYTRLAMIVAPVLGFSSQKKKDVKTVWQHIQDGANLYNWQLKRPSIKTISTETDAKGNKFTFIQEEITEGGLTLAQAREYKSIFEDNISKQPAWFKILPAWMQVCFKNRFEPLKELSGEALKTTANEIINTIPAASRKGPGVANFGSHYFTVLKTVKKQDEHGKEYEEDEEILRSKRLRSSVLSPIDVDLKKRTQSAEEDKDLPSAEAVDQSRQKLTTQNLEQLVEGHLKQNAAAWIKRWELDSASSRIRRPIEMPVLIQTLLTTFVMGLDRFGDNESDMMKQKYAAVETFMRSFEQLDQEIDELGTQVLKASKEVEESERANEDTTAAKRKLQSFERMLAAKQQTLAEKLSVDVDGETFYIRPRMILTDHPINKFRRFSKLFHNREVAENQRGARGLLATVGLSLGRLAGSHARKEDLSLNEKSFWKSVANVGQSLHRALSLKLKEVREDLHKSLEEMRSQLHWLRTGEVSSSIRQDLDILSQAVEQYLDLTMGRPLPSGVKRRGQQLFLSSLEKIITSISGGIPYGSCKSGKDREGLETLHTDAMLAEYAKTGHLPSYYDPPEKRQAFIQTFKSLYETYHQQANADQNAFGAKGLKSIKTNLPADIRATMKEIELKADQKAASANKRKPIVTGKWWQVWKWKKMWKTQKRFKAAAKKIAAKRIKHDPPSRSVEKPIQPIEKTTEEISALTQEWRALSRKLAKDVNLKDKKSTQSLEMSTEKELRALEAAEEEQKKLLEQFDDKLHNVRQQLDRHVASSSDLDPNLIKQQHQRLQDVQEELQGHINETKISL